MKINRNVKRLVAKNNILIGKTLFLGCLLFFSFFSKAQHFEFSKQHILAYQEILALQNPLATQHLQELSPSNGITLYLQSFNTAIEVFIQNNEDEYTTWLKKHHERIDYFEKLDQKSAYYLFTLSEIHLHAAFLKFSFGDKMSAFWDFRKAYHLLQENQQKYPTFSPNLKNLGALNIVLGSVPSEYTWIMNRLGFFGNINKGFEQLQQIQNSNSLYNLEATIYTLILKTTIFKEEKEAIYLAQNLKKKYPKNLLLHFLHNSLLQKMGENEQVLQNIAFFPQGPTYITFPYLAILSGDAFLQKGLYKEAVEKYQLFLNQNKGKNYLKYVYYRLFLVYQLQNQHKIANNYLQKCLDEGQTLIDADKHAEKFANSTIPDNSLLKARLYTDGGYYQTALNCLQDSSIYTNHHDQLDFYYRKARIFDKTKKYTNAIFYYKKVILLTKEEDSYYFAPNSCLQLGYIYQELKNDKLAKWYFEKALKYEEHEYKNSIDNKAKAGLSQLSK